MIKYLVLFLLFLIPNMVQAQTWEEEMIARINVVRADADAREIAIYGSLAGIPRAPLTLDASLSFSAQWWCDGLKGTGLTVHGWYANDKGYLIDNPTSNKVLNRRVWLPTDVGWTDFNIRHRYMGLQYWANSENGYFGKSTDPKVVVDAWTSAGYDIDPRKVRGGHYLNLIETYWTHAGPAKGGWGGGRNSVFIEFMRYTPP